jgi:hypothetical protein
LHLSSPGETAPSPGYREVREWVLEAGEPAAPRETEGIET